MKERYSKKISDLPKSLRPREKLMAVGAKRINESDLLAILIGKGTQRENAIKIASNILHNYKLSELPTLDLEDWDNIPGIGKTKAIQLLAALELGRRIYAKQEEQSIIVDSYEKMLHLLNDIRKAKREHLVGIYLDGQDKLLVQETLAIGKENISYIHVKDIIQPVFRCEAMSFIIAHNHPHGKLEPSEEDIKLTLRIKDISERLDLHFIDHIIVTMDGYYSFKDKGKI
jgi:DNA repair protein RadC